MWIIELVLTAKCVSKRAGAKDAKDGTTRVTTNGILGGRCYPVNPLFFALFAAFAVSAGLLLAVSVRRAEWGIDIYAGCIELSPPCRTIPTAAKPDEGRP